MTHRPVTMIAAVISVAIGFGGFAMLSALLQSHLELFGAILAWYALAVGCAMVFVRTRD